MSVLIWISIYHHSLPVPHQTTPDWLELLHDQIHCSRFTQTYPDQINLSQLLWLKTKPNLIH